MRDFSKVGCSVWHSRKFRSLRKDHTARYLYLYLLTNPHSNSAGCYNLPEGYPMADMELDLPAYREAMERLSRAGLIRLDEAMETVLITNWVRFNEPTNAKHAIGILTQLDEASSEELKTQRFQEYEEVIAARKLLNDKAGGAPLERLMIAFRKPSETKRLDREIDREENETRPRVDETEIARARDGGLAASPETGSAHPPPDEMPDIPPALDRRGTVTSLLETPLMRRAAR